MAKKLVLGYEIDANNNAVILPGNIFPEKIQLITDVEGGTILYNFADPTKGYTSVSFSEETEKTTVYLDQSLSGYDANTAKFQIFVDEDNAVDFNDELLDPVNKIRVSNPENLIDTDFEYGLQSTKWETLELAGNIPSFYASGTDGGLRGINSIETISGSNLITVRVNEPHGLTTGNPILVQGLTSVTAEGKYLINTVIDDNTFTYKAKKNQSSTGTVHGPYTTIDPGQFYVGSQIDFETDVGITTDQAANSLLTVTTAEAHGFQQDSQLYLVNTISPKKFTVTQNTASAPDGDPYVDNRQTISTSFTANTTFTETKQMRGMYYKKITADNVDVAGDRILWSGHQLRNGDALMYLPSNGDEAIGGLTGMNVYHVRDVVAGESFKLCENFGTSGQSASTVIPLTSAGTYNYGRGQFLLAYQIYRIYSGSYWYDTRFFSMAYFNSQQGSGWDLYDQSLYDSSIGYIGLMGARPKYMVYASKTGNMSSYMYARQQLYYPWDNSAYMGNSNQRLGLSTSYDSSTDLANSWNFMEDITRYSGYGYTWQPSYRNSDQFYQGHWDHYQAGQRRSGTRSYNVNSYYWYMIPITDDEEADSFYFPDASFSTGDQITLPATTDIKYPTWTTTTNYSTNYNNSIGTVTSGGSFNVEAVTPQRIRLNTHNGGHTRITSAKTSSLNISGVFDNQNKNTFYLPDHGISTGDVATITAAAGGAVPATVSGTIELDGTTNLEVFTDAFDNTIENFLDTYSGSGTVINNIFDSSAWYYPMRYNNSSDSSNYIFSSSYIRLQNWYINESGYTSQSFSVTNTNDNWMTGLVNDPFKNNTTWSGRGYRAKTNVAWEQNKVIPYFTWAVSIPKGTTVDMRAYAYPYQQSSVSNSNISRTRVGTSDWYYQGTYNRMWWGDTYGVVLRMRIWNEAQVGTTQSFTNSGNNPLYVYGSGEDYIDFGAVFQKKDANWTTTEINQLYADLGAAIETAAVQPTLSSGDTIKFDIISSNRVAPTTSSGQKYIFDDQGTPDLNLLLEGSGGFGILDGTYSVYDTPSDTTFRLQLPFEAVNKEISFNSNTAVSNTLNTVYKATGHTLLSGTPVTYVNETTEAAIDPLVNNATYYAYVYDDVYFGVCANVEATGTGDVLELTSSQGNHKFTANVVNGLVPAQGNVTISGTEVTGTSDALFKRYYKAGDEFIYIDNSTTPGSIEYATVASITDDTGMTLVNDAPADVTDSHYMIPTSIYTRPDGTFQHRPFDGGVEITAGSSPDSQIIRQTRKYFRYQSGKGIQVSLAINFNPTRPFLSLTSSGNVVTGTTEYPHGIGNNSTINVFGSTVDGYNGQQLVSEVPDDFTLKFETLQDPAGSVAGGFPEYNVTGWDNSAVRAGLFDDQNGMFWEYNGDKLFACRRSSTQQIPGRMSVRNGSNLITGTNCSFTTQLNVNDMIVVRGMSYKVVKITDNNRITVQPAYRGSDADNVIGTKTVDVKIPQDQWNEDVCDGTGKTGFILDINKIQMAYIDYSWYGAGKIRFGFKTRHGRVNYVHSFLHNNRLTEAYMRSGNVPARYEIQNTGPVNYIPSLFHWGTSVIMDGRFDDDKAYLFTGSSDTLTFTNGESNSATTTQNSRIVRYWNRNQRTYDYYVELFFSTNDASKFSIGTKMYTTGGELEGEEVYAAYYSGSSYIVRIYAGQGFYYPSTYPVVPTSTAVSIGAPSAGGDDTETLQNNVPLISIRLSPSVDNGITGDLGDRDIINRMQLQLKEAGVIVSEDSEVSLIINGNLSNINYENVESPSLSNLIKHDSGDTIIGGKVIYSFRAASGASTTQDLSQITDLGNSILGGDGVFPNGPDVITVAVRPIDTSQVSASNPYTTSARITWTESQA